MMQLLVEKSRQACWPVRSLCMHCERDCTRMLAKHGGKAGAFGSFVVLRVFVHAVSTLRDVEAFMATCCKSPGK